jgi:hypothetical protein
MSCLGREQARPLVNATSANLPEEPVKKLTALFTVLATAALTWFAAGSPDMPAVSHTAGGLPACVVIEWHR